MFYCNYPANFSCCFYRKKQIKKVIDLVDNSSDWLINTLISKLGNFVFLKEKLSVWRIHDKGSWSSLSEEDKNKAIKNVRKKIDLYLDILNREAK
jgi:hypothetical protein